jgi:hypothetical protein
MARTTKQQIIDERREIEEYTVALLKKVKSDFIFKDITDAIYNAGKHLAEHRTTRTLGRLLLDELLSDVKPLLFGNGAKHDKLIINGADLLIFNVG